MVKKSTSDIYLLLNVVVKFHQVTLKNANLFFFVDKFSEKFIDYANFFFINLFLSYDQVELDE